MHAWGCSYPSKSKGGEKLVGAAKRKDFIAVNDVDFLEDLDVVFNLSLEPWLVYSLRHVADRGMDPTNWTSYRLKSQTFYFESNGSR